VGVGVPGGVGERLAHHRGEVVPDGRVSVEVVDDGVGLGPTTRRSGLANLRSRAEGLGGTFVLEPGPRGGTRVCWSVPTG
jgi:signal transduction histidine kinase